MEAKELIGRYRTEKHIENGLFIERHYPAGGDARPASGSIYYYVAPGEQTKFHRIDCDEYWCFGAGSTLELRSIGTDGELKIRQLGITEGAEPFVFFPAGEIFAARLPEDAPDGTFVTCITVPRFTYGGMETFSREELSAMYPGLPLFPD